MTPDETLLRECGDRIDQLLDTLEGSVPPTTWRRVEELVQQLVALYGSGLERALAHAVGAGADPRRLDRRLRDDELMSSLLVLHGLVPETTEQRVLRALDDVRPMLESHAGGVELISVEDGVVRLRLTRSHDADGSPSTLEHAICTAIARSTPEVRQVLVDAAG
jgi:Fe-S cluster biogenesis protein NfuA